MPLTLADISPQGSSLLLAENGAEVFFKVPWIEQLQQVEDYAHRVRTATLDGMFEVEARWIVALGEAGPDAYAVELEWTALWTGVRVIFKAGKWDTELRMVHDAGGRFFLIPADAAGEQLLERALGVETPAEILGDYITPMFSA